MNIRDAREKAVNLVRQMTLEEKISQMMYRAPAIERLGLKEYNWWNEALHGVARAGSSTIFPQSIAMSASFDRDLPEKAGSVTGQEGRLKNRIYRSRNDRRIYKGLTYWSPNINIVRDPRWGRGHESYGEDPYLNAQMGSAFVRGLQGTDPERLQAAACVKHFAVHSGPEQFRHGFDSEVSPKELRETYLPAFEKIIRDAEAAGVMTSYNAVNGVPTSASTLLFRDILRKEWGFKGYTVSDCGAVSDIYEFHHYTDTREAAAAAAVNGGCNLNCGNMYAWLLKAAEQGLVSEDRINEAVENLLTVRFRLDMEEDVSEEQGKQALSEWIAKQKEWKKLNEKAAEECVVLLKNNGILPLKKSPKTIAVIGPDACSLSVLEGNYHGTSDTMVTVDRGIREEFPGADFLYSEGSHLYKDRVEGCSPEPDDRISEAAAYAAYADVTFAVVGLAPNIEGEAGDASNEYAAGDKHDLHLPACQQRMLEEVCRVSDRVVVILMSGGALDLGMVNERAAAVLQGWYPGAEGGKAIAGVLSGRVNPTGRLPLTFYYNEQVDWPFADYHTEGKTYRFFHGKPLYSFGYGIGYEYLRIQAAVRSEHGVRVVLQNDADHEVSMPVQIYAHADENGLNTPIRQMVGMERVTVPAGSEKTVEIALDSYWLQVVDETGNRRDCSGTVTLYVGDHQPDDRSEELCRRSGRQACLVLE